MVLFYSGLGKIARVLRQEVERYAPASATAAKQFNEQLKLTAATINGVAIAVVSIFVLTTMMKDSWPNPTWLLLSIGVALQFHVQARALLGMMKDESPPALPGVQ
jgi:hypothetical protein